MNVDIRTVADQLWRGEIDTTTHHPVAFLRTEGEEIADGAEPADLPALVGPRRADHAPDLQYHPRRLFVDDDASFGPARPGAFG